MNENFDVDSILAKIRSKNKYRKNKYPAAKAGSLIKDWNGNIGLVLEVQDNHLSGGFEKTRPDYVCMMRVKFPKAQAMWMPLENNGNYVVLNDELDVK